MLNILISSTNFENFLCILEQIYVQYIIKIVQNVYDLWENL